MLLLEGSVLRIYLIASFECLVSVSIGYNLLVAILVLPSISRQFEIAGNTVLRLLFVRQVFIKKLKKGVKEFNWKKRKHSFFGSLHWLYVHHKAGRQMGKKKVPPHLRRIPLVGGPPHLPQSLILDDSSGEAFVWRWSWRSFHSRPSSIDGDLSHQKKGFYGSYEPVLHFCESFISFFSILNHFISATDWILICFCGAIRFLWIRGKV